jgi:hypothetical protein
LQMMKTSSLQQFRSPELLQYICSQTNPHESSETRATGQITAGQVPHAQTPAAVTCRQQ